MGIRARELILLLVADMSVLVGALWLALALRHLAIPSWDTFLAHIGPFLTVAGAWVGVFWLFGLYDRHTTAFLEEVFRRLVGALVVGVGIAVVLFFILPTNLAPKTILAIYTALVGLGVGASRWALLRLVGRSKRERAVIVGEGSAVHELAQEVRTNAFRYPFTIVATVSLPQARRVLPALLRKEPFEWVILDTSQSAQREELVALLVWATERNIRPISLLALYTQVFGRIPLDLEAQVLLEHLLQGAPRWYEPVKRAVDIVLALGALACVGALIPLVWFAYRLEGVEGGIWYVHERVGRGMRPFRAIKFRTLQRLDPEGQLLDEAPNPPTKVGRILRGLSLDELPQALNVLRGEMSFIGPRADAVGVAKRLAQALPFYPLRYLVAPGLTGWAQTHQRYAEGKISPQNVEESAERLSYDLYYVANFGWWVDVIVLLRTVRILLERAWTLVRRGASAR